MQLMWQDIKIKFVAILFFLLIVLTIGYFIPKAHSEGGAQVYFGAYTEGMDQLTSFESNVGKKASLFMFFHAWNAGGFPTGTMEAIRNRGSIPVVSWSSYVPDNDNTSWKNIANGNMDGYIAQWAKDSKAWGHPYFLRFDWEMNGYWQPYSSQADSFIPMWKHVHDIFTREGATNVTWVWCPNVDGYATRPLEQVFPGNDYVDWVCMDGYNFGTTQSWSSWTSFSSLFTETYNHLLRLAPGKPIMIAEMSSAEQGGSKADWIKDMLGTQLPQNFPNVKAFIWFNLNKEADWRAESSDATKLTFAQYIASSYYASNEFGGISTSPIPYLGGLSSVAAKAVAAPIVYPTFTPTPTLIPTVTPTPTVVITPKAKGVSYENYSSVVLPSAIFLLGGILLLVPIVLQVIKKRA